MPSDCRDQYEQFLNELHGLPLFDKYPPRILLDAGEYLSAVKPILQIAGLDADDIEQLFEQAFDSVTHYGFALRPAALNLMRLECRSRLCTDCEFQFPNDMGRSVNEAYIFLYRKFCDLLRQHGIDRLKSSRDDGLLYYFYELRGDCIVLEKIR
jgi:hypothetical protein